MILQAEQYDVFMKDIRESPMFTYFASPDRVDGLWIASQIFEDKSFAGITCQYYDGAALVRKSNLMENQDMSKSLKTKMHIISAAEQLFFEKGFVATTQQEIAEMSGTNRGLIYHYFDNMENIATIVFEKFITDFHDTITKNELFKGERDALTLRIVSGRILFRYLLSNDNLRRFYCEIASKGLITSIVENAVYLDFKEEAEYLGIHFSQDMLKVNSGILTSIELKMLEFKSYDLTEMSLDEIITIYNDLHLTMLKLDYETKDSYISRCIELSQKIGFSEPRDFKVSKKSFFLLNESTINC